MISSRNTDSARRITSVGGSDGPAPGQGSPPPLVLFLSRVNTGASIMAEAILRHLAHERVRAASAGECAALDAVHPVALECLLAHGVPSSGLHSKRWGEFFGLSKPPVRFLITLGEVYASNANWSPNTLIAVWNTSDPATIAGREVDIRRAFDETYAKLHARIEEFLSLQSEHLDDRGLLDALAGIGER